jgi:hypothetical protein
MYFSSRVHIAKVMFSIKSRLFLCFRGARKSLFRKVKFANEATLAPSGANTVAGVRGKKKNVEKRTNLRLFLPLAAKC